jgi:hypothetical protein
MVLNEPFKDRPASAGLSSVKVGRLCISDLRHLEKSRAKAAFANFFDGGLTHALHLEG